MSLMGIADQFRQACQTFEKWLLTYPKSHLYLARITLFVNLVMGFRPDI